MVVRRCENCGKDETETKAPLLMYSYADRIRHIVCRYHVPAKIPNLHPPEPEAKIDAGTEPSGQEVVS